MAADSGPSRDRGSVETRAGQKSACYPVAMNFGKPFSLPATLFLSLIFLVQRQLEDFGYFLEFLY